VDASTAVDAEARLYDNLFSDSDPDGGDKNFLDCLNSSSLEVLTHCKVEASLANAQAPISYQFLRQGYFCPDSKDSAPGHLVFNRSVSLKDGFKVKSKQK
jgi:glutaminyl-tRNA synthetase